MLGVPAIRAANQLQALAYGYIAFSALYLGSSVLSLRAPAVLTGGALDAVVPFLDWSVWIYLSQFVLLPAGVLAARDDADRSRVFYSVLLATVLAAIVFVAWPTRIERPAIAGGGPTAWLWALLYFADTPGNCFPSLHVALAFIAARALYRRGLRGVALVWFMLVAASTLTTKQHIAWDAAGGLALGALAWSLIPKLVRYEHPQTARNPIRA
jgi:membrane-associated phospholipid phosphatase